jgi:DNA-binding Lrp family transcriptional regulator
MLDILQQEGALSVADVAARARQSTTTCWRRIQQLEKTGVIKKRVALLDRRARARRHDLRAREALDDRTRCDRDLRGRDPRSQPKCSSAIR